MWNPSVAVDLPMPLVVNYSLAKGTYPAVNSQTKNWLFIMKWEKIEKNFGNWLLLNKILMKRSLIWEKDIISDWNCINAISFIIEHSFGAVILNLCACSWTKGTRTLDSWCFIWIWISHFFFESSTNIQNWVENIST